ncbi:MAG: hypothetical protein ACLQPV_03270 [Vulcanimicrobiaceae bacterium]
MRALATFVAGAGFDAFAVSDIDSGDALALATRFALQWAYRGRQALFWTPHYEAKTCRDEYLPFNPARPFERRASIHIEGSRDGNDLALFATRFSDERGARVPELRVVRNALRKTKSAALVFADNLKENAFADLGFERVDGTAHDLLVVTRGVRAHATCSRI